MSPKSTASPKSVAPNLSSVRRSCTDEAGLDATLEKVRAAGYPAVQVSGVGPVPPRALRRLADAGIRFGCHNHAFEFDRFDGRTGLELLLERTDPRHLALELDTYWTQYGGGDPVDWIRRAKGRIPAVHLKDYAVTASVPHFAEVGHGNLAMDRILAACRDSGVAWYIVEQDEPLPTGRDIFESVRMS